MRGLNSRPSALPGGSRGSIQRSWWAIVSVSAFLLVGSHAAASSAFVRPGHGIPADRHVWGHHNGIQIGIAPTKGPRGLIRIFAPHVGVPYPNRINYLSIEPTTYRRRGRDQSELALSEVRGGQHGLHFFASNTVEDSKPGDSPATGVIADDGQSLQVCIHTERFPNGALPIIEVTFRVGRPNEFEIRTHSNPEGATMAECVVSATMGNYSIVRTIRLPEDQRVSAEGLWDDDAKDNLGFLPWRDWRIAQTDASSETIVSVESSANSSTPYSDRVPKRWRYLGRPNVQSWIVRSDSQTFFAVNARDTYWGIGAKIPGGRSIENFEIRRPFVNGQSMRFRIELNQENEN